MPRAFKTPEFTIELAPYTGEGIFVKISTHHIPQGAGPVPVAYKMSNQHILIPVELLGRLAMLTNAAAVDWSSICGADHVEAHEAQPELAGLAGGKVGDRR